MRTLSAQFLPMIGLKTANFCDGPYDGGKDFTIIETVKGIKIGIQLSVEKDWRSKIKSDAIKTKSEFQTNLLYFISSRRIPEGSFVDLKNEILQDTGVSVTKYDNQAIASNYIKNNNVNDLLKIWALPDFVGSHLCVVLELYIYGKTAAYNSLILMKIK